MTGKAEQDRKVLPDPTRPELRNGDFEEISADTPPRATGWHYQRLMEVGTEGAIPSGKRYVTFRNTVAGRPAQALQGFAVDGRKVKTLEVTFDVQGKQLRPAVQGGPFPHIAITFFDDKRAMVGEAILGAWRDTFTWQSEVKRIPVPLRAREAIFQLGLIDGIGEISFDNIRLRGVK
jgi:protein-L-isoaspartate(D-aspartate) O-methyltransferase